MWSTLLSLIPSIVGMFSSSNATDEYNSTLESAKANQKLSNSALQAKSLYAENANRGLAGYETMKEDINNQLPETLNASKDWLSGGGAVKFLADASANTNQQLRNLNTQNEQQKQSNMEMYAKYLGGPMAMQENQMQDNRNQLSMYQGMNNYNQAGTQNQLLGQVTGSLGKLGDMDWSKLIALLSKGSYPSVAQLAPKTPSVATFE